MTDENRSRMKDFWQLHVPLIVVLIVCTSATLIEFRRAQEGVDRAWAYTLQWPIIGAFAVVVWNRYRKHGSITRSISRYFRERAARFEAAALALEAKEAAAQAEREADPDAIAWREHVRELRRNDPPGGPPPRDVAS